MSGERDLQKMLQTLSPVLLDDEYVFCSFAEASYGDHTDLQPVASIAEAEGLTLVVPRNKASERGLNCDMPMRCIRLSVHSSLEAVGLTAAFSARLGERDISANVVAGYYHDHIFVQSRFAQAALDALNELAQEARRAV